MAFKRTMKPLNTNNEAIKVFKPSEEQVNIINEAIGVNNIAIEAFAGAAKTSTCVMVAEALEDKNILMICFNKSIADEAKEKFPSNTTCQTINSLAWRDIVKHPNSKYGKKLGGKFKLEEIELLLDYDLTENELFDQKLIIEQLITDWCNSAYSSITAFFLSEDFPEEIANNLFYYKSMVETFWEKVIDQDNKTTMTHSVYLKLFQLKNPILNYDLILLDECLPKEQSVKTSKGLYSIKRLYDLWVKKEELPEILSFNIKTGWYEFQPMLSAMKSDNRKIYLVKTEGLNRLECTSNHKILTHRGYVEAGDLIAGKDVLLLDTISNQKTKYLLGEEQYQILLGSILGDGHLAKQSNYNTFRLHFTQGEKQYGYLEAKANAFLCREPTKGISGYTGRKDIYSTSTKTFILPEGFNFKDIDARALAIWYMDDGSFNDYNITINSNSFSLDGHEELKNILKTNFNLDCKIKNYNSYYDLRFDKENSYKLFEIINPYYHEDLAYKNPTFKGESYIWKEDYKTYGGNIVTSIEYSRIDTVYDIEVANNHNFITQRGINNKIDCTGIIVHNCQDTNPVSLDIFLNQNRLYGKQLICVGDRWQSIYAFRGAIDAFGALEDSNVKFKTMKLTTSFRFGSNIAKLANDFLSIAGEKTELIGGRIDEVSNTKDKTIAYLHRTNLSTLTNILECIDKGYKINFIGDLKDLWNKAYHIAALLADKQPKIPNNDLINYKTKKQLLAAAKKQTELASLVSATHYMINNGGVYNFSKLVMSNLLQKGEEHLEHVSISTIHKSKGMEWDIVYLGDDCLPLDSENIVKVLASNQTLELIYIGMTRAKEKVILPLAVQNVLINREMLAAEWEDLKNCADFECEKG